jgi:hypothetical protein
MIGYELSWKAPEGKVAKANLDSIAVDSNAPVVCRTWWEASLLAARIAYDNESLTDRVCKAAELIDSSTPLDLTEVEVNGWVFTISDVRYAA